MPISTLNSFDIAKYYLDHKHFIIEVSEAAKSESWDYQIAKPCCCSLGKDLKTHEGKPFTEHPSWHKAHALHHELIVSWKPILLRPKVRHQQTH
jgi:hypothetical protein